jgi:hypothetical protein
LGCLRGLSSVGTGLIFGCFAPSLPQPAATLRAAALLSLKELSQTGEAIWAYHLACLIEPLAAKYLFGFIKWARSIIEKQSSAIVTSGWREKNVANARIRKANGRIARIQFSKACGSNRVLARSSTTRKVAATGRLNKTKQRVAFVGDIGSSEDQSSENDRNRHRACWSVRPPTSSPST